MYKISDFAKATKSSVKTLRYYDEIDLFKPAVTDSFTGYRYYEEEQIKKFLLISELKEIVLSLEKIKRFLDTNDIRIISEYKKVIEEKTGKIEDFINKKDENIIYTLEQGDYNKYVELNGKFRAEMPQALDIKNNQSLYYIIYKNNELFDDFWVDNEDNWLTIDRRYLLDNHLMSVIITILKEKHNLEYITVVIPGDRNDIIDKLKDTYNLEASIKTQSKWIFIKVKIFL